MRTIPCKDEMTLTSAVRNDACHHCGRAVGPRKNRRYVYVDRVVGAVYCVECVSQSEREREALGVVL